MRLNPFAKGGRHGQTPRELRAENQRLTGELSEANKLLDESDQVICKLIEERDWFHDRWIEVGEHAAEAEIVVGCLEKQLAEEKRKVADLEAIAGPHRPSADELSPIYAEVTGEHPLPDFSEETERDPETTVQLPAVRPLAEALAGTS